MIWEGNIGQEKCEQYEHLDVYIYIYYIILYVIYYYIDIYIIILYVYIYIDLVMEFIYFDGNPKTMVVCILNQGLMTWMMWGYLDFKKPPHGPQAQPGNGTGKDLFPKPGWTVIQLLEEKISIGLSANGRFFYPQNGYFNRETGDFHMGIFAPHFQTNPSVESQNQQMLQHKKNIIVPSSKSLVVVTLW